MPSSDDDYPWGDDAIGSDDPGMDAVIEMSLQAFHATNNAGPSTPVASASKSTPLPSSKPKSPTTWNAMPNNDVVRERQAELRAQVDAIEAEIHGYEVDIHTLQATIISKADDRRRALRELEQLTLQSRGGKGKGKDKGSVGIDYASDDFDWTPGLKACMKRVFGIDGFRLCQQGVCNANMDGRDIVCVMPTGGGKSLTYQLPALLQPGCTLVISPLISLITDQILHLQEANIEAVKLTGGTPKAELKAIEQRLYALANRKVPPGDKEIKLCYVTPEKFVKNKGFQSLLQKLASSGKLARIVIDEAHCVSQLGHDFRPDYAKLYVLRQLLPGVPIMALSATCPPKVLDDLLKILCLKKVVDGNAAAAIGTTYFSSPLYRKNLHYSVVPKPPNAAKQLQAMADYILAKHPDDSGIIYCLSRKDAEVVAEGLFKISGGKIKTGVYHADRGDGEKDQLHRKWRTGVIKVVCATIAFGLGIDKGNVRFVLHHTISKSLDGFYQESGRAGRDGKDSDCVMYYHPGDSTSLSAMVAAEREGVLKLRDMISFAQNLVECRKILFARYFSLSSELALSSWTTEDSNALSRCGHCDNCLREPDDILRLDVTHHAWQIVQIASAIHRQKGQVTLRMLVEVVRGNKTPGNNQEKSQVDLAVVAGGPVLLSKLHVEHLVVHMLVEGYLDETLKQTTYTTIAYLIPGIKAPRLLRHNATSLMNTSGGPEKLECVFLVPKKAKRASIRAAVLVSDSDDGEPHEVEPASASSDNPSPARKPRGRPRKTDPTPMPSTSSTLVSPTQTTLTSRVKSRTDRQPRRNSFAVPVHNVDDDDDDEVEIIENPAQLPVKKKESINIKKEDLQLASLKPIPRSAVSLGKRKDRQGERKEDDVPANGYGRFVLGGDDDDAGDDCEWVFNFRGSEKPPPVKKRVVSDRKKGEVYVLVPSPRK